MDLVQTVRKEGSRGGRADFKWEDVKNDAQRENYLGHSIMAPVGRWQQGRDLGWYAKGDDESKAAEAARIKEEKRKIKEAEEDAMLAAMGLPVPVRDNANLTPLGIKAQDGDAKDAAVEDKAADRPDKNDGNDDGDDRAKRKERKERRRRHRSRTRSRDRDRHHRHRDGSRDRLRHDDERDDNRRDNRRDDRHDDRRDARHGDRHDDRRGDRHDRRRRRSPSREHKRRDHRSARPRDQDTDDKPPRPLSRDEPRRATRSRSPYAKTDRRR